MAFQKTIATLKRNLDAEYPNTGTIGYLIPLSAQLALNQSFTADAPSNVITFTAAQKFKTGGRVRFVATATLPTGLIAGTDYYLHRLTNTTYKICTTLANAIAGTEINLMDSGSGTLSANEQSLTLKDPIEVLLSHEFTAGTLAVPRLPLTNVGPAVVVVKSGKEQAQKSVSLTIENMGTADITVGYFLLTYGGTAAIGSIPPDHQLETLTTPFTVPIGEQRIYGIKLEGPNF
jgi:hypothetical protein